jgi:hypothetical protein
VRTNAFRWQVEVHSYSGERFHAALLPRRYRSESTSSFGERNLLIEFGVAKHSELEPDHFLG